MTVNIPAAAVASAAGVIVALMIWGAIRFRRAMRQLGEIIAKQSEKPDPDPGDPHEITRANRHDDEDPR